MTMRRLAAFAGHELRCSNVSWGQPCRVCGRGAGRGFALFRTPLAVDSVPLVVASARNPEARVAVEGAQDYAVFLLDADGCVASWNAGARALEGYDEAEVLGRHLSLFFPEVDLRRGIPEEALRRAVVEGQSETEGWRVRKDGTRFWASGILTALNCPHGGVRGFVKVTRDLTSRRAAEEERERLLAAERQTHACAEESWGQEHRARTEAEAALAARDQVMAELAHDLQQPLTAIRLGTQVIERFLGRLDQESEESAIRAAAILKRTVERMARWVADLRDVAQLRAGQELPLDRRPTDLVALARRLVEEHQRATERHRIRLVARPTTLVGTWDEARLERVLDNLLGNAVKFSPDGGDIEVEVEEDQPSGWALLRVRDAGLGIPSAELPRLFEMFHRASNVSDRVQGSGLGLASARAIVERHGGTVLVESREGVGSTFTMKLPLDEPSVGHRSGVGSGEAGVPAERSDKSARG